MDSISLDQFGSETESFLICFKLHVDYLEKRLNL